MPEILNAKILTITPDHLFTESKLVDLLNQMYCCYEMLILENKKVPKHEPAITKILVNDYFSKRINTYEFIREKKRNIGKVDIFISFDMEGKSAHFTIECKILDNNKTINVTGHNREYIDNGIKRFLTEYYSESDSSHNTDGMIGYVVQELNIEENIVHINELVKKLLKNLIFIEQEIVLLENNIYKSIYIANQKRFDIYHLMFDFSKHTLEKNNRYL